MTHKKTGRRTQKLPFRLPRLAQAITDLGRDDLARGAAMGVSPRTALTYRGGDYAIPLDIVALNPTLLQAFIADAHALQAQLIASTAHDTTEP